MVSFCLVKFFLDGKVEGIGECRTLSIIDGIFKLSIFAIKKQDLIVLIISTLTSRTFDGIK